MKNSYFTRDATYPMWGENTLTPKNCKHKYNRSTINFFGNVWTSHLGFYLF